MSSAPYHTPALLEETLEFLALRAGAAIVDGTLGGGGHAAAILEATAPDGRLLGLDVDEDALAAARARLAPFGERVRVVHASFRHLREVCNEAEFWRVDGILLDLGVSSHQLDSVERGFRFSGSDAETPLDMRMDRSTEPTAAQLLARTPRKTLVDWFRNYGELRGAVRLAAAIVETRQQAPLTTAADLLRLVEEARVGRGRRHHPATLVFQALRIAVNDELAALREGLEAAVDCLTPGGRLLVIAYHSLEDRLVKRHLREEPRLRVLTRKVVRPVEAEVRDNPRARSARLRAAERLPEAA